MKIVEIAVPFDELPPEFQAAVSQHLGGVAERQTYGYGLVSLKWLASEAARIYGGSVKEFLRELVEHQESKDDYQWPPEWASYAPESMWPVFLSAPPGGPYPEVVIEDGLHRFRYYLERYQRGQQVPVVWVTPYRILKKPSR